MSGRWELIGSGVQTRWSPLPSRLSNEARLLVQELRTLKDSTGLSLAGLSARTHYSRSSWERWLNGKRLITAQALTSFADAAGADGARLSSLLDDARSEPVNAVIPERGVAMSTGSARLAPRTAQVPAGIQDFTGRQAQVRAVTDVVTGQRLGPGQVPVAIISGALGTGKTALATHVAHHVAGRFPDGTLYAGLRGTAPDPRDPADVLADWLLGLGEPAERIAPSLDARSARLRSLLHDRRILLLLDDARDAAQVRPLLPAAAACAVLVTSRRRTADLVPGHHFELGPMPDPEARALLESIVGPARLAGEPAAAEAIRAACAGLPLALRIAGTRLATRPAWGVQWLASRLADPRRLLDELTLGDLSVRDGLRASFAQLPEAGSPVSPRHALRLLASAASPEFSLADAAALLGIGESAAERLLDAVIDARLVDEPAPGWYRLHNLTRLFAVELAPAATETAAELAA